MFNWRRPTPNTPIRVDNPRPESRVHDNVSGDAGRDGFTRISQASRETSHKPTQGGSLEQPRYFEDS